jgi:hypothetical protein|tara:strand:+ start:20 stop:442 length:423 start_codon:yes stop_codon:yes gene_type:complete
MAITQAMCTQFKKDVMLGLHDLDSDTIKIALYTSSATLSAATDTYTTSNEVANGGGYTTGGVTLANASVIENGTSGCFDSDDPEWTSATFTARGALIYNDTDGDRAIAVLDFGGDFTVAGGTFKIVFPAQTASNAIVRID